MVITQLVTSRTVTFSLAFIINMYCFGFEVKILIILFSLTMIIKYYRFCHVLMFKP